MVVRGAGGVLGVIGKSDPGLREDGSTLASSSASASAFLGGMFRAGLAHFVAVGVVSGSGAVERSACGEEVELAEGWEGGADYYYVHLWLLILLFG